MPKPVALRTPGRPLTAPHVPDPRPEEPSPDPSPAAAPHFARAHLFADLRGYTAYVESHGDHAGARLIERYRVLVRGVIADKRGREIRTEGDSFYVVFESASDAIRAGQAILAGAASDRDQDIRVGVGIHAGEAVATAEGYVGAAVNLAARICAQAGSGELVVSDTVRGLTRTYLDLQFVPLGARRLKGVAEPVMLFRVAEHAGSAETAATKRAARGWRSWARPAAASVFLLCAALAAVALVSSTLGPAVPGRSKADAVVAAPSATGPPSPSAQTAVGPQSASPSLPSASPTLQNGDATPPTGPFPSTAEQALLAEIASVPGDFAATCSRGPYSFVKAGTEGGSLRPVASLSCTPVFTTGANKVTITQFAHYTVPYGFVALRISKIVAEHSTFGANGTPTHVGIPPGDCAKSTTAQDQWSVTGHSGGARLCYVDGSTGDAIMVWSIDDQAIVVTATNARGDHGALLAFFNRIAPFLVAK